MPLVNNQFIQSVSIDASGADMGSYPFNVPAVKHCSNIVLNKKITFLIGDNGMGKSTLIESLAVYFGLNPEGGSRNIRYTTRDSHSDLKKHLHIVGFGRPTHGYFLRAESFYTLANFIDDDNERDDNWGPSIRGGWLGKSMHSRSHGESFWDIIETQFRPNGIYILDEPESALSFTRLIALIYTMNSLTEQGCQFVVSTHSPILLGCPNSEIFDITSLGIHRVSFADCRLTSMYKRFLANPQKFLDDGMT